MNQEVKQALAATPALMRRCVEDASAPVLDVSFQMFRSILSTMWSDAIMHAINEEIGASRRIHRTISD